MRRFSVFWENHDLTQGMRQGNDRGTQYRSGIYTHSDEQQRQAEASKFHFEDELKRAGFGAITTEIQSAATFYYRRDLPSAISGEKSERLLWARGTGVSCPISLGIPASGSDA